MKLLYYRRRKPNFGDDLNTVIWPSLVPGLFDEDPRTGFVGIGTIIGMPCGDFRHLHVFSSGVGNDWPGHWSDRQVEYWCVRGPVSTRVLNLPEDRAITDGGILTPLIPGYARTGTGTRGTLVIPHWETLDYPGWAEATALAGQELLDPRADPQSVTARIATARLVLTESLHGAVLADTLGVPWLAFATSKNFGVTKWVDWTLSLGRDLTLAMVPPPDAGPLLAFGRPPAPFGTTAQFDAEAALAQFDLRLTPVPETLRAQLKGAVRQSPLMRRFLGFSPARTAEALDRLAQAEPSLTSPARLQTLQDRMHTLLLSFAASQGAATP